MSNDNWNWTITSSAPAAISAIFPDQDSITLTNIPSPPSSKFEWTTKGGPYHMTLDYNSSTITYSGTPHFAGYNWEITIVGSGTTWSTTQLIGTSINDSTTVTGCFVAQANTGGPPCGSEG